MLFINLNCFFRPISVSLSPNTEKDDLWLALKLIFSGFLWKWKKGEMTEELENEFKKYLGVKYAVAFNSGRSSLMAILNSLDLQPKDEVLLQTFTCNAAVNPIIWSGLKPVFVDCDEKTFNIDIEDLKRKISSKSKIVVVQHTFGLPVELDEIVKICKQNNLILIEDCAHSLGAEYKDRKVGIFGRASFFSFGRDKVISSVYGGIAITNDDKLAKDLRKIQAEIGFPSNFWILQQLLHPILMNCLILPTYRFLGKYLLVFFQKLHILSKAVHPKEKQGQKPDYFPRAMPNALAILALNQFKKLQRFNDHREKIANFYFNYFKSYTVPNGVKLDRSRMSVNSNFDNFEFKLPLKFKDRKQIFLRFTIKNSNAHQIIKKAWEDNFLIGDWYTNVISPNDTNLKKMGYKIGDCPKAEKLAKITLNLPTHINISEKQAQKIVDFLFSKTIHH